MKALKDFTPDETILLFVAIIVGVICAAVLPGLLQRRRDMRRAMRALPDLGAQAAQRLQYLETNNERLVRENGQWRARANELVLHLDDRDRKLEALRAENAVLSEKGRVTEDALHQLRREYDDFRREGAAARPAVSVERPYGASTGDRQRGGQDRGGVGRRSADGPHHAKPVLPPYKAKDRDK